MSLVEMIREKQEALRVRDLAHVLGVSHQQIYKLAASGEIPSFKVANSVRFDPEETAEWLKKKYPVDIAEVRRLPLGVGLSSVHHSPTPTSLSGNGSKHQPAGRM